MTDRYSLSRFLEAQAGCYDRALAELTAGCKQSHWMWFIFPQIAGLGRSATAQFFAITGRAEANAYLGHALLGPRLAECTRAMLSWAGQRSATEILGPVDALKFASCMTLFDACAPRPGYPFADALAAFYHGQRDQQTLALLQGP